jgi:hypothetical protein
MRPKPSSRGTHVSIGGVLYIRSRNTRLLERPDANAGVLAVLQPPAQVVWFGPHKSDRRWHMVKHGPHTGVVVGQDLSKTTRVAGPMG